MSASAMQTARKVHDYDFGHDGIRPSSSSSSSPWQQPLASSSIVQIFSRQVPRSNDNTRKNNINGIIFEVRGGASSVEIMQDDGRHADSKTSSKKERNHDNDNNNNKKKKNNNKKKKKKKKSKNHSKEKETRQQTNFSINKRIFFPIQQSLQNDSIQFLLQPRILYALLALIAFRKDIHQLLLLICYQIIPTELVDPDNLSGERRIVIRWSTDVLKLVLVGELMRRFICRHDDDDLYDDDDDEYNTDDADNDDEEDLHDGANVNQTQSLQKKKQSTKKNKHNKKKNKHNKHNKNNKQVLGKTKSKQDILTSPAAVLLLLVLLSVLLLPLLRQALFSRNSNSAFTSVVIPLLTSALLRSLLHSTMNNDEDQSNNNNNNNVVDMIMSLLGGKDKEYIAMRHAYLPPLTQHYTFEQLNERYYRDWIVWRKAFPTNPVAVAVTVAEASSASATSSSAAAAVVEEDDDDDKVGSRSTSTNDDNNDNNGGGSKGLSRRALSLPSSLMSFIRSTTTTSKSSSAKVSTKIANKSSGNSNSISSHFPSNYNNGTVIVMDMTKLDTQASRMESIRDQISFLIQLVNSEDASYFSNGDTTDDTETRHETNATISNNATDYNNVTTIGTPFAESTSNLTLSDQTQSQTQLQSSTSSKSPTKQLEIIILLESPGGAVSPYGLAASHLQRLRSTPGIKLTICIDTVAASGGYMMACMSSPGQLYCAPFAMVGSIGVVGQSLNLQKTLESYGVRPYVFRGGKMKNPVGMVGEVTKEGLGAVQDMVDRIHGAFRDHVANAREEAFAEALDSASSTGTKGHSKDNVKEYVIDEVATGDVFLGMQAIKLGLVDRLITSDEYIAERIQQGARVLKLIVHSRPMGLSDLILGPSRRGNYPSIGGSGANGGALGVLKHVMFRMLSSLLAWVEPIAGLESGSSAGSDVRIHSSLGAEL